MEVTRRGHIVTGLRVNQNVGLDSIADVNQALSLPIVTALGYLRFLKTETRMPIIGWSASFTAGLFTGSAMRFSLLTLPFK